MDGLQYENLLFRSVCILRVKEEAFKNQLIASSFSAWQMLSAKGLIKDSWRDYLSRLQLLDKEELYEGQLKEEYNQAMLNAQKIIERVKRKGTQ